MPGPDVDAEVILMCRALWRDLGLVEGRDVRLELNSLGQPDERQAHRAALIAHFEAHADLLDDDARRRLHSNPLRILDTKNPAMQAVVDAAPKLMDFLGDESLAHFDAVRAVLDAAGLAYTVNPRLVRGMDYYNLTVFEWITDRARRAGHGLRRRPLRRPVRAARRQAGARRRLRPRASSACCCCSTSRRHAPPPSRPTPTPSCPTPRRCRR